MNGHSVWPGVSSQALEHANTKDTVRRVLRVDSVCFASLPFDIEFVEPGSDEEPSARPEEQAVGEQNPGAAELDDANLVPLRIEDVGVGHGEGEPEVAVPVDGCRANR